jgi:hypothetical protein
MSAEEPFSYVPEGSFSEKFGLLGSEWFKTLASLFALNQYI